MPKNRADGLIVAVVALVAAVLAWFTSMPIWAITIVGIAIASVEMFLHN